MIDVTAQINAVERRVGTRTWQAGEATAEALLETALRRGLPAHRVEGPEELDGIEHFADEQAELAAFPAGGFPASRPARRHRPSTS